MALGEVNEIYGQKLFRAAPTFEQLGSIETDSYDA